MFELPGSAEQGRIVISGEIVSTKAMPKVLPIQQLKDKSA
jgi:hypothetical protein